jgi:hypothetical protein
MSVFDKCAGFTEAGAPCAVTLGLVDGLCAHHDPKRRDERKATSAAGGRASGESRAPKVILPAQVPPPITTLEDCMTWASWVAGCLAAGTVDTKTAHEINISITSFRSSYDYAEGKRKVRELEKQLARFEKEHKRAGR